MRGKTAGLIFFVCISGLYIRCNKSIDTSGKQAYLSITHVAPDVIPLDILFENDTLVKRLGFDSTTGITGNPYLNVISGIHNFKADSVSGKRVYINGNIGPQAGKYYSVFIYDTLSNDSLKALVLQDGLTPPADTMSYFRFLNFYVDTLELTPLLASPGDTIAFNIPYVGANPNPSELSPFSLIKAGLCQVFLFRDSTLLLHDSIQLTGGKIYTIFTSGSPNGSGQTALGLKSIQHN